MRSETEIEFLVPILTAGRGIVKPLWKVLFNIDIGLVRKGYGQALSFYLYPYLRTAPSPDAISAIYLQFFFCLLQFLSLTKKKKSKINPE